MPVIRLECPNCGRPLVLSTDGRFGLCPVDNMQYLIEDGAIKHKVEGKIEIDGLTTKTQLHNRANQLMEEGNFSQAASLFHEIIDIKDARDSDAWWGLARIVADDFRSLDRLITREQLGQNYIKAMEYATADKRAGYEAMIRRHEEGYRNLVAEREARERDLEKLRIAKQEKADREAADTAAQLKADALRKAEEEREREEERIRKRKEFLKKARKAALIALVILAFATILTVYVFIPNAQYGRAVRMCDQGDYTGALQAFEKLNGYKQSEQNILLCRAMISLITGDIHEIIRILKTLENEPGGISYAKTIRQEIVSLISNWEENNVSPTTLLSLIKDLGVIDPEGTLDAYELFLEAQVAMAGGKDLLSWRVMDQNLDETDELLVLEKGFNVKAYRMLQEGQSPLLLDEGAQVICLLMFGDEFLQPDIHSAFACYQKALEVRDTQNVREKVGDTYLLMAQRNLDSGDIASALENRQNALNADDTVTRFDSYAQLIRKHTEETISLDQAIAVWNVFMESQAERIKKYGRQDEFFAFAGEQRLRYALELASRKNYECIPMFQEAETFGSDIAEALGTAASQFELGRTRTLLRVMQLDRVKQEDGSVPSEQAALMASDLERIIPAWDQYGMEAQEVYLLLKLAGDNGARLSAEQRQKAFRSASLSVAGGEETLAGYAFVDWDEDGTEELAALTTTSIFNYYVLSDDLELKIKSSFSLPEMLQPTISILSNREGLPFALITGRSSEVIGFALFSCSQGEIIKEQEKLAISHFTVNNETIQYFVSLEGSTPRFAVMRCDLNEADLTPVMVEIDWQKASYVMPKSAMSAAMRYFEALYYCLPEERQILTGGVISEHAGANFTNDVLTAMAPPLSLADISIAPYRSILSEDTTLLEARYTTEGRKKETVYLCAVSSSTGWRITGASPVFSNLADPPAINRDPAPPLWLNGEVQGYLSDSSDVIWYRILLPYPAELRLSWQAGSIASPKDAFSVSIFRSREIDDKVVSYTFKTSKARYQREPLFLSAGVYDVSVAALQWSSDPYTLALDEKQVDDIELEKNDTYAKATLVNLNTAYSASLQTSADVDSFRFKLDQPGRVNLRLSFPEKQNNATLYVLSLTDGQQRPLFNASFTGRQYDADLASLFLGAGEYFAQVKASQTHSAGAYSFYVAYQRDESTEREWNGEPQSATELRLNSLVTGTFTFEGDVDCYRFTLAQAGSVRLSLSSKATGNVKETYRLTLLGGGEMNFPIMKGSVKGTQLGFDSPSLFLPAGTYALKLENPLWNPAEYTLHAVYEAATSWEVEDNNSLGRATPLTPGIPLTATLMNVDSTQSGKDHDLFTFTLDKPGRITVALSFEKNKDTASCFMVAVASAAHPDKPLYIKTAAGDSGGLASAGLFLNAGIYFVQVDQGDKLLPGAYHLLVTHQPDGSTEREWNGEAQSGTEIMPNVPLTGAFAIQSDVEYFRLTLPQAGTVRLSLSFVSTKTDKETYRMTLLGGRNLDQTIWDGTVKGIQPGIPSPALFLPTGTYTVKLENPLWNPAEYNLLATYEAAASWEIEDNNTMDKATLMTLGMTMSATLMNVANTQTDPDTDLFAFTLPNPGKVTINLSYEKKKNTASYFKIALASATHVDKALYSGTAIGIDGSLTSSDLYLDSGKYFVQVIQGEKMLTGAYHIQVSYEPDDATEREWNGSIEDAADIKPNSLTTGTFACRGDADVFKVRLSEQGVFQIGFNFTPLKNSEKAYVLQLLKGSSVLWSLDIAGQTENILSPPTCLTTGEYYVMIDNPAWNPEPYRLSASFESRAAIEFEPNGTIEQATELIIGTAYTGSLHHLKDKDIYKLSLNEDRHVTFNFSFPAASASGVFDIEMTQDGKSVWNKSIRGSNGGIKEEWIIPKGTYFIQVSPESWSSVLYELSLVNRE